MAVDGRWSTETEGDDADREMVQYSMSAFYLEIWKVLRRWRLAGGFGMWSAALSTVLTNVITGALIANQTDLERSFVVVQYQRATSDRLDFFHGAVGFESD